MSTEIAEYEMPHLVAAVLWLAGVVVAILRKLVS
jgi:hypothetical protein